MQRIASATGHDSEATQLARAAFLKDLAETYRLVERVRPRGAGARRGVAGNQQGGSEERASFGVAAEQFVGELHRRWTLRRTGAQVVPIAGAGPQRFLPPEREMPGTSARHWVTPMISVSRSSITD